jgi:protein TonB
MSNHAPAFLISALVHGGLFALLLTGIAQLPSDTTEETRLAVTLEMFQPPPPPPPELEPEPVVEPEPEPEPVVIEPPPPKPKPKPKPKKKPKPEPPPEVKPVAPVRPPPPKVEPKPVAAVPVVPAVDPGLIQRIEDEYKAALRQAIEKHKTYPRRAVRLRKQGEVVMGFTVLKDGTIQAIRVVQSSGVSLLDKAAKSAVKKTSGSLPFPGKLERSQWDFTIPIKFSLR